MSDNKALKIDVEKVIEKKSPKLAKWLPGFVIRYLKRITHQEEINKYLERVKDNFDIDFVHSTIEYMGVNTEIHGFENIPKQGSFIFVANHPLGALESLVMMREVAKIYPKIKFPVNDILMNLTNLKGIFVPVNKLGSQSRQIAKDLDKVFESDAQVLFFPAGMCSRKIKGEITDLQWQKSFVPKVIKSQRDVIPVYIEGRNSNFFYNLSRLRSFLGIKANIEMLYLVDEMYKQRGQTIKLTFGKPFSYKNIDKSKNYAEWAEFFKRQTYNLANKE